MLVVKYFVEKLEEGITFQLVQQIDFRSDPSKHMLIFIYYTYRRMLYDPTHNNYVLEDYCHWPGPQSIQFGHWLSALNVLNQKALYHIQVTIYHGGPHRDFPFCSFRKPRPMIGDNRQLVTNEPVEFEE